jgi:hypothetical protein
MIYSIGTHVCYGAAAIKMHYTHDPDSLDCMSLYKLKEWKGAFGHRPFVCCQAWTMIYAEAGRKKISITHFYWALYWMRTYQTEDQASRNLGTNPKTFREKVKTVVLVLSQNMSRVVSWIFILLFQNANSHFFTDFIYLSLTSHQVHWKKRKIGTRQGEKYTITVDGTHFLIEDIHATYNRLGRLLEILFQYFKPLLFLV